MFSEMKTREQEQARSMRREEGRSIKEIARLLGVSTSSVSHWVRDIEQTDAQHAALQARNGLHERQRLARAAMAAKAARDGLRLSKRVGGWRELGTTGTSAAACCIGLRDLEIGTKSCSRTRTRRWPDSLSGSSETFLTSARNDFG
jgi:predicted transcriptional regulator